MNRRAALHGLAFAALAGPAWAQTPARTDDAPPSPAVYRRFAGEMDLNLRRHVIDKWLPRAKDDARGGFRQNYAEDWSLIPREARAAVYQARLTWLAAQGAKRYPAERAQFQALSNHGLAFMADQLWDADQGGFFWGLEPAVPYGPERFGEKHIYGHAFSIYAAAENHAATGNPAALALAQRAFLWMEQHAHDGVHGGYYESLDRQSQPILAPPAAPQARAADAIGTVFGRKTMNTHIHILEALTGLYEVWPDPRLRSRLQEVFEIVRDKVATEPGYLNLFFQPDWTPVPSVVSFGHDVETGFLLVEASTVLGRPNDIRTWTVARRLVDRPLAVGWDEAHGGFYDEAEYGGRLTKTDKVWWVQAEGLNALLVMHEKYGAETPRYWRAFQRQWAFIRDHQTDPINGGWYSRTEADGRAPPGLVKSDRWTEGYHQGRALIRVSDRLRADGGLGWRRPLYNGSADGGRGGRRDKSYATFTRAALSGSSAPKAR